MPKVVYSAGQVLVAFDAESAANKSEKDFVVHEQHHQLTDAQLKEAHKLCKKAVEAPKPEPATPTT